MTLKSETLSEPNPLYIPGSDRPKGTYISGEPGLGKSSLLLAMALRDIQAGHGVCVIDPHADLVNTLLTWIPRSRINDTIYFDTDNPVPIDFFSYRNPPERQVLTDQLLALFSLENAPIARPRLMKLLGTLFDANENGGQCTFLDIKNFLEDKSVREAVFDVVPHRRKDWPDDLFKKPGEFTAIIERMIPYDESPALRKIFSCAKPKLNIWDVMQERRILLIKLRNNATDHFIGSLISAKIHQATEGRADIDPIHRIPFYLYIDECHRILKFAEQLFEDILTGARKFRLALILSNQLETDLPKGIREKLPIIKTQLRFIAQYRCLIETADTCLTLETPSFRAPKKRSYAQYIKDRTRKQYSASAQNSTNRPVDKSPSQSTPNLSDLKDDGRTILPDET
jgi:hypothetical protein